MPGGLRYFTKDPNGKIGRWDVNPRGVFYYRGHGKWSKYGIERDMHKLSRGWKVDVVGLYRGKRGKSHIPQVSDGNLGR
jgi:hypothetical protein